MSVDLRKELSDISRSVQAHQKKVFGRVLTQEELDASDAEDQDERIKKFAGMTPVEAAAVMEKERLEWEKEMVKEFGPSFLDFKYDDEEE
jgi:hypothetical protein